VAHLVRADGVAGGNRLIRIRIHADVEFDLLTTPTPHNARAFDLLTTAIPTLLK
jgi:hypothetical protein